MTACHARRRSAAVVGAAFAALAVAVACQTGRPANPPHRVVPEPSAEATTEGGQVLRAPSGETGQLAPFVASPAPMARANVSLLGHVGGATFAAHPAGRMAYVGVGPKLLAVDMSDPTKPMPLGELLLPGLIWSIDADGTRAYVAAGFSGLAVVDAADPSELREIGHLPTPGEAWRVNVADGWAYVAWGAEARAQQGLDQAAAGPTSALWAVDVTYPEAPRNVATFTPPTGFVADVALQSDRVLVADGKGVSVLCLPDLRSLGYWLMADGARRLAAADDSVAVLGEGTTLHLLRISGSEAPIEQGQVTVPHGTTAVTGRDEQVVLLGNDIMRVLDIAGPASPRMVGELSMSGPPRMAAFAGDNALVAAENEGLRVVSLSDPRAPHEIGSLLGVGTPTGVAVSDGVVYLAEGTYGGTLRLLDVRTPGQPHQLALVRTPGQAWQVTVANGFAFVADWEGGMRVVDVHDPTRAREIGSFETDAPVRDVCVRGRQAYLAADRGGLRIVDVGTPSEPREIGSWTGGEEAWGVVVAEDLAYVAERDRVRVIDVTDPRAPRLLGETAVGLNRGGLAVGDGYAYVGTDEGLYVIDVHDPGNPHVVGGLGSRQGVNGVFVQDRRAYLADTEGLRVLDITNPAEPQQVGSYPTAAPTRGVAVANGMIFLAAYEAGLYVLSFAEGGAQ